MVRFVALVLMAAGALMFAGCASSEPEDPNHVSTIPWNKPEPWESQGPMGGMMNPEGR